MPHDSLPWRATGPEIEIVARDLLGEPNREKSTKHQLRFGTQGSMAVEIGGNKAGTWYDFEDKVGGGPVELVKRITGKTIGEAVDLLHQKGIEVGPALRTERREVAAYDYTDAEGNPLFQVVRYAPKTFVQRRRGEDREWIWGLNAGKYWLGKTGWKLDRGNAPPGAPIRRFPACPRVPYRLPELIQAVAEGKTIWIPEGEKDVDKLRSLGFAATCNPGGAGKWLPEFKQYLRGARVVVLPDNDKAGREHASMVIDNLLPVAEQVFRLDLPDLPDKGDVSNWLAASGTAEALKQLAESGPSPDHPSEPPAEAAGEPPPPLADFLSSDHWRRRALDLPEPLLGELIVNTTRMFIGGNTGLGKTNFILGMAGGMANGTGFLHWPAARPARVLLIDGEMPRDLVQERLNDLYRRMDVEDLPNLFVFCREDAEDLAERYPELGEMQPLNTPEGQAFVLKLIEMVGGVDVVFFDNRMSLLSGDMKDEQPWTDTMPLVKELTKRRIAQIWIDHTGHDPGKLYGTKTKEWQFDTVALMEKAEHATADIAFSLSFKKARRRKPSNRADFETVRIVLADDTWQADGTVGTIRNPFRNRMPEPAAVRYHEALVDALCRSERPGSATLDEWRRECERRDLLDPLDPGDDKQNERMRGRLKKYRRILVEHGWITYDPPTQTVRNLRKPPS